MMLTVTLRLGETIHSPPGNDTRFSRAVNVNKGVAELVPLFESDAVPLEFAGSTHQVVTVDGANGVQLVPFQT